MNLLISILVVYEVYEKVQVGNDQEKAQSERNSNSKIQSGKETELTISTCTKKAYRDSFRNK